ncbi:hypothetical protein [Leifsonia shinshuensis]|uniref:hypothetical protein n=1 Tax=Leifsonia shinshuensis TaxID=150026 RepID=UPI00285CBA40|nr:hypothetical protein [Leifsonia shinshuensis]MDR6973301.1 hypothetical protein [Leifsonia shinshuensis]
MPDPQNAPTGVPQAARPARPGLLVLLTVIVALEAVLVLVLAVWLLVDLLTVRPTSYPTAVAITVLAFLAAAWAVSTTVGLLRRQSWARASTVTIQILQLAVAVGCFQGLYARPDLGWALLVPAVIAGVLALTPSVVRATARNTEQHE